jgi:hypothetical protein
VQADQTVTVPTILQLLEAPPDGRVLAFGAATSEHALQVAAERPDLLIMLCDTSCETTREVSDRALADGLNNIIVGDTHAGPPVDRGLSVGAMATMVPAEHVALRTAMLAGGYAIFIEPGEDASKGLETLRGCGYQVADELPSPIAGHFVIRAR